MRITTSLGSHAGESVQDAAKATIQFQVLGSVEARVGGVPISLGPARQRSILAALLIDAGHPVPISTLIERVWGDAPPGGVRSAVYTYITRLRRVLADCGTDVGLNKDSRGYWITVPPAQVDLHRLRILMRQARREPDPQERCSRLHEAVSLWTGEPLGCLDNPWAERFREGQRPLKFELLCDWADSALMLGCYSAVIERLTWELMESPLTEQLHERLLRALYHGGQRAQALQHYENLRCLLAEELGIDPGEQLQDLHQAMLRGETTEFAAPAPEMAQQTVKPQNIPRDVVGFCGRQREIAQLTDLFTAGTRSTPPTAVITGGGGMGKTALAIHTAHLMKEHFPDGLLYLSASDSDGEGETASELLRRLLLAMGEEAIAESAEARAMQYRSRLAGKRLLIVVDQVTSERQTELLLPSTETSGLMITSRSPLYVPGGTLVEVGEVDHANAIATLSNMIGPSRTAAEPAALDALVRMCGGMPLALHAVTARLATHPHWRLKRLVDRLSDESRRLEELRWGSVDVRDVLDETFRTLDALTAGLFLRLAALGEEDASFDAEEAMRLSGHTDATLVEDCLEKLADVHFLRTDGCTGPDGGPKSRYRMGALHRLYARSLAYRRAEEGPLRTETPLPPVMAAYPQAN